MQRQRGGRGGRGRDAGPDVGISKNLSWLLRHGAIEEKLNMDSAGFVLLDEILAKHFYKSKGIGVDKIREIVESNDKKRFELKTTPDASGKPALYIRATQGHSIKMVEDEELLEKIVDASKLPLVVHGTYREPWKIIQKDGLKPMTRNHIHFAVGYPGGDGVISGMRKTCSVYIELDIEKALQDGMELLISKNGVILTRGLNGGVKPEYFKKVLVRTNDGMQEIDFKTALNTVDMDSKIVEEEEKVDVGQKGKQNKFKKDIAKEQQAMKQQIADAKQIKEPLKYLLVLDFEAQCTKDGKLNVQEIIELPVVVIDIEKKEILPDPFHTYIKPKEHPKLYPFCIELTGITQDKIDNGIYLEDALEKLDIYLESRGILSSTFAFVTCGHWDIRTCLKSEAIYKKIQVKEYLKSWINIKEVFPRSPNDPPPRGMTEMLDMCGLPLIGRHHSGIDDANNIAAVVVHLLKTGWKVSPAFINKTNYKY